MIDDTLIVLYYDADRRSIIADRLGFEAARKSLPDSDNTISLSQMHLNVTDRV